MEAAREGRSCWIWNRCLQGIQFHEPSDSNHASLKVVSHNVGNRSVRCCNAAAVQSRAPSSLTTSCDAGFATSADSDSSDGMNARADGNTLSSGSFITRHEFTMMCTCLLVPVRACTRRRTFMPSNKKACHHCDPQRATASCAGSWRRVFEKPAQKRNLPDQREKDRVVHHKISVTAHVKPCLFSIVCGATITPHQGNRTEGETRARGTHYCIMWHRAISSSAHGSAGRHGDGRIEVCLMILKTNKAHEIWRGGGPSGLNDGTSRFHFLFSYTTQPFACTSSLE